MHRSIIRHFSCYTQPLMHLERNFSAFPWTNWLEPSFERLSGYAESNAKKSFNGQMFHVKSYWSSHTNIQRYLNLTVYHMAILLYQLSYRIDIFWHNNLFWTTFLEFVLDHTSITIIFVIPIFFFFTMLCAPSLYKELSSSKQSCLGKSRRKLWKIIARKCSRVNSIFFNEMSF